jgi:hypothetical protein
LGLRDSTAKKEKTANLRIHEQQKKRHNMKELLVQNLVKRYMQRFEAPSAANSALMARIIANEIDLFLDGERSTQGLD